MSSPNYITKEGFEELQNEFRQLFHVERPELVKTVTWAASNGDRSENADYIYGKKRLRQIDSRLKFLRDRIESAQVIDPKNLNSETIVFGATVTVCHEDGTEKTYFIVGEDELKPGSNRVSWKAPMARALIGKKVGDEATVKRPKGNLIIEILKIEFK